MKPTRWLPVAALLVVIPFLGKLPTLDEESYLWLAAHLDPLRPYDWSRVWPPYDADGFVYAHPPLHLIWLWAWSGLADVLPAYRLVVGAPWIVLYAWATGALANRVCRHPGLACGLWLASATVALGLQDTLMIDLPAVALGTAALAFYREGLARAPRVRRGQVLAAPTERSTRERAQPPGSPEPWFRAAGLALGLGLITKYPVMLVGLALLFHMARHGWRPAVVGIAAAIFGVEEAWVAAQYGQLHLYEVWARREEIASGPMGGRALGALVRMSFLPVPLALLRVDGSLVLVAGAMAGAALAWAWPGGGSVGERVVLFGLAMIGSLGLARSFRGLVRRSGKRRRRDEGDSLLLGGVAFFAFVGVVGLHNYAAARYLLPAATPIALLVTRAAEEVEGGKWLVRLSILFGAMNALVVVEADRRFVAASDEVAALAVRAVPFEATRPPRFAGEWSARRRFEAAGWSRYRYDEVLPSGTVVVVMDNAGAGLVDIEGMEPTKRITSADDFPVRVSDTSGNISLYSETLGALPLGWRRAPLDGATLYVVRVPRPPSATTPQDL